MSPADGWPEPVVLLETPRLRLRSFSATDLPAYTAMNLDPEVMRWLGGPWTPEKTERIMRASNAMVFASGYGKVAMERRADGVFLGMCGVSPEPWYPDLEIGWRLAPEFWGFGYASEAAAAWLAHGFGALGQNRLISIADVPNARSIAVMRRLGMRHDHDATLDDDGVAFEASVYAMTAEQWSQARTSGAS